MALKSISCTECRKQHRKCERSDNASVCTRCQRMQLICVLPSYDGSVDPNEPVDGTKQMKQMRATVDILQRAIEQVETEMNQYRSKNHLFLDTNSNIAPLTNTPTTLSEKSFDPMCWLDDSFSESSDSTHTNCSSGKSATSTCNDYLLDANDSRNSNNDSNNSVNINSHVSDSSDSRTDLMEIYTRRHSSNYQNWYQQQQQQQEQQQQEEQPKDDQLELQLKFQGHQKNQRLLLSSGKEWKLSLVNGQWRIETGITTISGLEHLSQILYPPPASMYGHLSDTPITIEPCDSRTIFPFTVKLARKHLLYPPQRTRECSSIFATPALLINEPRLVIDTLVYMYLKQYNPSLTLVHELTFMAHYRQLEDPQTCPVTMAICCYVCCDHRGASMSTILSSNERRKATMYSDYPPWFSSMVDRRAMGEYFYQRCRDILDDIFDDPRRQLETVMAINFLIRFLMNTLRISEMRKLETMAYLICTDLKPTYQSPSHISKVERALFARHYAFSIWCYVTADFFKDSISRHSVHDFIKLNILPGESDYTRQFLDLQNYFFEIFLHPAVIVVFDHVQHILLGSKVEMTLDMILRFEQVTNKWWQDLPADLRLCEDPYNSAGVKKAVEQSHDDIKLTLFIFFMDVIISLHACLLKVQRKVTTGDQEYDGDNSNVMSVDDDVISLIQEKSVKLCLEYSETMILLVNQLDANVAYSQFLGDMCLFVAVDILASLSLSDDKSVAHKAKQKMAMCFSALDAADFMDGHRVPLASSPLTAKLINSNATLFHLYNQYPQPRYALLYDICRFLSPLYYSL